MKTHPSSLAAKVAALNRANTILRDLVPRLQQPLTPWIGKKVLNQGRVFSSRFREYLQAYLPPMPDNERVSLRGGYTISVEVEVRELCQNRHGETSECQRSYAYLAETDPKALTLTKLSLFEPDKLRTDYSEAEVIRSRERLSEAEGLVSQLKTQVEPWGRYDAQ